MMRTWIFGMMLLPLLSSLLFQSADIAVMEQPGQVDDQPQHMMDQPQQVDDQPRHDTVPKSDFHTFDQHKVELAQPKAHSNTPEQPKPQSHSDTLEQHVDEWIRELAQSGSPFDGWAQAEREIKPLGPGTNAWIVFLSQNSQQIGYLIVGSDLEGSFQLIEYATGEYPLFSVNTLHRALVQSGLIPHHHGVDRQALDETLDRIELIYNNPFEALWEVEHGGKLYWFEAKTGQPFELEESPANTSLWASVLELVGENVYAVAPEQAWHRVLLFDPYDHFNWLVSEPIAYEPEHEHTVIEMLLEQTRITFLTSILNDVKAPFAVTGFQAWGEDLLFLQIEDEGGRYISFPLFEHFGEFYPDL